jgi:DNA-binding transcriptional LysR family regulator
MPLDIEENLTANLDGMLKAGLIDAAIVALPYGEPGLTVLPLYSEDFRVIVPAKHRWARRHAIRAEELAGENLLLLNAGHCFRDQVLDACREFTRPTGQGKQGNSLETIRNMVTSGMGISVLPRYRAHAEIRDAARQGDRLRAACAVAPHRARVTRGVSTARGACRDRQCDCETRRCQSRRSLRPLHLLQSASA